MSDDLFDGVDHLREVKRHFDELKEQSSQLEQTHNHFKDLSELAKKAFQGQADALSEMTKNAMQPVNVASVLQTKLMQMPKSLAQISREENLASEFCKRLNRAILNFDKSLDQTHEVGALLASFGNITIHLRSISSDGAALIKIEGETDSGAPVELIQHVTQIGILLIKLPRLKPDTEKVPFGFHAHWEPQE